MAAIQIDFMSRDMASSPNFAEFDGNSFLQIIYPSKFPGHP